MTGESTFLPLMVWGWMGLGVLAFLALLFVPAPYGRHHRKGWGPSLPGRLGWIVQECPATFVFAVCLLVGNWPPGPVETVLLVMWEIHYLNRVYVFPFRLRSPNPIPLPVILMAILFNTVNGYLNGRWLALSPLGYAKDWFLDPRFIAGVAIFMLGFAINQHSDAVLIRLRSGTRSGYSIPRGGLYRYVSCPNYLGEILEWSGWALAAWSFAGLSFAVWTIANLAPRAISHHRWYRATFPEYPKERKALVPFLL